MKKDFELIIHRLGRDLPWINVYPLGDVHIGSQDFDLEQWNRWKEMVMSDPYGYVVLVGDLVDNGLRNSKTNPYEATMRPREQKEWLKDQLRPLKNRILGGVQGNHEIRSVNESDDCPMYDVMAKLDLEDLYRENMAFIKVSLGEKNKERQFAYTLVLGHGASKGRVEKFSYSIDGMDALITGHTHQGSSNFYSKIVIDPHNEKVRVDGYTHLVVPSFAKMGGYALRAMYSPQDHRKIPILSLSGKTKEVTILWR